MENQNDQTTETPEEKITRLESEVEKSKKAMIQEMNLRGQRCGDEIRAVLAKHNCTFSSDVQVMAKPF